MITSKTVPQDCLQKQHEFIDFMAHMNRDKQGKTGECPKAFTDTYGCQQNEADTQRIAGMLHEMGYVQVDDAKEADVIVLNTCAVRESAENHVLGNLGSMAHYKEQKPELVIAMCGCMVQQEHMPEKIRKSYPQVDLVFGTHVLWRFPELLYQTITGDSRVFDISEQGDLAEGLPVLRDGSVHAWLSIMYGCNNFCTYCIVPYVRGRERSRLPIDIEDELRGLIAEGYKDITLLGQNVNSYGKDLQDGIDFSDLLRRLNAVAGDFQLRFMTSHPKDASFKLFDTMAQCEKVAHQLHLPFQSGSDEILRRMNRGYTAAHYKELISYARSKMPYITISSDIIVGFPGESEQDFEQTLSLVREIHFNMLYTFQYSRRSGTPAASYDDLTPYKDKQARFAHLLRTQDACAEPLMKAYEGKNLRVLIDGHSKREEYPFTARTAGGLLVYCGGTDLIIGTFADVTIEKATLRSLLGRHAETRRMLCQK